MRELIEELKNRISILDIADEEGIKIQKRGRNYFACCPFHGENTASFSLSPEKKMYKCFGCGEQGDVIDLLEKMRGITQKEARDILLKRAGLYKHKGQFKQWKQPEPEPGTVDKKAYYSLYHHLCDVKWEMKNRAKKYTDMDELTKDTLLVFFYEQQYLFDYAIERLLDGILEPGMEKYQFQFYERFKTLWNKWEAKRKELEPCQKQENG